MLCLNLCKVVATTKGEEEAGASMIRKEHVCLIKGREEQNCSGISLLVLQDNPKFVLAKTYNKAAPNVGIIYPE